MQAELGRSFDTFVRSTEYLRELIESDPFAEFGLPPDGQAGYHVPSPPR